MQKIEKWTGFSVFLFTFQLLVDREIQLSCRNGSSLIPLGRTTNIKIAVYLLRILKMTSWLWAEDRKDALSGTVETEWKKVEKHSGYPKWTKHKQFFRSIPLGVYGTNEVTWGQERDAVKVAVSSSNSKSEVPLRFAEFNRLQWEWISLSPTLLTCSNKTVFIWARENYFCKHRLYNVFTICRRFICYSRLNARCLTVYKTKARMTSE